VVSLSSALCARLGLTGKRIAGCRREPFLGGWGCLLWAVFARGNCARLFLSLLLFIMLASYFCFICVVAELLVYGM